MTLFHKTIRLLFAHTFHSDIEILINNQLENVSDNEFIATTVIEALVMPPRFGGIRFYGPYGEEGEISGYYDLEFDQNGKLLHSRLNIDADEATETAGLYYPEETRYWP